MLKRHISNIFGKTTKRHLVAFFMDDYGAIINNSAHSQSLIKAGGVDISKSRFMQYDCLETDEDIEALFDVLLSYKDIQGRNVVWTPLAVCANPDFEKIRNNDYSEYCYKILNITYSELDGHQKVYEYIKKGIATGIFLPQFHGREHINIRFLMDGLRAGLSEALIPFNYDSLYSFRSKDNKMSSSMAFKFYDQKELMSYKDIIQDGLDLFEKIYGYRAVHFNAPGERENSVIDQFLFENGIKYIETDKLKKNPEGAGRHSLQFHWNGQKNSLGQRYIIRNCVFEPTLDLGFDWADYTFKQVEIAFKWNKPAIISGHRVNFSGGISSKNREIGLSALRRLLDKLTHKYSDIEFVGSEQLFDILYK